jgi:hypothetical protein
MAQDFYDIIQVLDYLHNRIDNNKTELGLKYITYGDEQLLPEYPALVLTAERPISTEFHATRQYRRTFLVDLWLFHARLSVGRRVRTRQDIELSRNLEVFLNTDRTCDGHVIHCLVESMQPIVIGTPTTSQKGNAVIGTRLQWTATNRVPFEIG